MKIDRDTLKEAGANAAKVGQRIGEKTVDGVKKAWETEMGRTAITGAAAGGAIAAVVPFVTVGAGLLIGGAISVLAKNARAGQ
ncbi:hypothetical protein [Sphingobium sp. EP60837]|uniref:hypothetical protein n=1 Tax=Sphingobium sp. EP60837 TaxID=1855519 RepID=UPI0007DDC623|nr:hypothetical protein [Sphingobium sp. EP60837]ANI78127.1 hypothetical protein EP837_01715 [Sphingobium sp. EP60837]